MKKELGRPKITDELKRMKIYTFTMTETQHDEMKVILESRNLNFSKFIRMSCDEFIKQKDIIKYWNNVQKEAEEELKKLCKNPH